MKDGRIWSASVVPSNRRDGSPVPWPFCQSGRGSRSGNGPRIKSGVTKMRKSYAQGTSANLFQGGGHLPTATHLFACKRRKSCVRMFRRQTRIRKMSCAHASAVPEVSCAKCAMRSADFIADASPQNLNLKSNMRGESDSISTGHPERRTVHRYIGNAHRQGFDLSGTFIRPFGNA